jgi:methylaspartate mutase epsilon subunit
MFARLRDEGEQPHLETFGGCLLGQLCPPSLLVAISVLEAMFFRQHGVRSVSLSYAQQTHPGQDEDALCALRTLALEHLSDVEWHVVLYAYMGVYPRTTSGAHLLLADAARLAVRGGASRLIVKTAAEAYRIPTVKENVAALVLAGGVVAATWAPGRLPVAGGAVLAEARALVAGTLELSDDIGIALLTAFRLGRLDVPWCLHPNNPGRARSVLDEAGRLDWSDLGNLPLAEVTGPVAPAKATASGLLTALSYVQRKYDTDHRSLMTGVSS